ncbi:hypothetical protein [Burkholderia gladioli]|uniref:hypothetical protein n=1 Tax=Burkholderia gladioli TaxID=28095 RepID=UPI00163F1BEF|nr:hypothetical protein [Burkholderia gladioli]
MQCDALVEFERLQAAVEALDAANPVQIVQVLLGPIMTNQDVMNYMEPVSPARFLRR